VPAIEENSKSNWVLYLKNRLLLSHSCPIHHDLILLSLANKRLINHHKTIKSSHVGTWNLDSIKLLVVMSRGLALCQWHSLAHGTPGTCAGTWHKFRKTLARVPAHVTIFEIVWHACRHMAREKILLCHVPSKCQRILKIEI
jgi:hypothetical protein